MGRALHAHPANVDGLLFMSRRANSDRALVVFDRAKAKLGSPTYTKLRDAEGTQAAIDGFQIVPNFA